MNPDVSEAKNWCNELFQARRYGRYREDEEFACRLPMHHPGDHDCPALFREIEWKHRLAAVVDQTSDDEERRVKFAKARRVVSR